MNSSKCVIITTHLTPAWWINNTIIFYTCSIHEPTLNACLSYPPFPLSGTWKILGATVNLMADPSTGYTPLHLALTPLATVKSQHSLSSPSPRSVPIPACPSPPPSGWVQLQGKVEGPGASVSLDRARLRVHADVASVLGNSLVASLMYGPTVKMNSEETSQNVKETPASLTLTSEKAFISGEGCVDASQKRLRLRVEKPIEAKFLIIPAVSRIVLSRINPLLVGIKGTEDRAMMMLEVDPNGGYIPAESYKVRVAPMTVVRTFLSVSLSTHLSYSHTLSVSFPLNQRGKYIRGRC